MTFCTDGSRALRCRERDHVENGVKDALRDATFVMKLVTEGSHLARHDERDDLQPDKKALHATETS